MKTQNTKLNFRKDSVVELNNAELLDVNGGSTPFCIGLLIAEASSVPCGVAAAAAAVAVYDYVVN